VVLEEDEEPHRSRLSVTYARIFSAALPSSSIFTESPRDGGGPSSSTVVRDPGSPASPSSPRSVSESVSCGFDFAPMIPLSEG